MTPRALVLGLLLSFLVGAAVFFEIYVRGSNAGGVFFHSPVALFTFFLLTGAGNVLLGALRPAWALRRGELVAVFVMMTLANAAHNPVHYWLGAITGPFYYATGENNWAEVLHPYIPDWIAPRSMAALRAFYEGSEGYSGGIDWKVWIGPILYWLPLMAGFHVACLCLMVALRRQWMDRERLIYPLVQVPLAMVQEDGRSGLVSPFFRSRVMWIGFSVPVAVGAVRGLHSHLPYIPTIELSTSFALLHDSLTVPVHISFATIGFFFFIKREISFGLWVFYLLNLLQEWVYGVLGAGLEKEPAISVFSYGVHSLVHQSMGAMIVLVLGGLFVARGHLKDVFRKAFTGAPDVDDSDEIISYRGAVLGLSAGFAVMILWLWQSGIPLPGVFVFLFFAFVVFTGLTRLVAEGGVAVIYTPLVSADAAASAMGTSFFGSSGMTGLMFTRVWSGDILNFAMPHCANGLKLGERVARRRRWLFWGMILASLAGLAGALWMVLTLTYEYGGINLRYFNYVWMPNYFPEYTAARIGEWTGPHWWGWFHTGAGAMAMSLLMLARRFWWWWPLHPIGFPISSTFSWMAFDAFLAWGFKGILLKYGGPPLYAAVRPFFLGLITGQFAICGIFWIIDTLLGHQGNLVFR